MIFDKIKNLFKCLREDMVYSNKEDCSFVIYSGNDKFYKIIKD